MRLTIPSRNQKTCYVKGIRACWIRLMGTQEFIRWGTQVLTILLSPPVLMHGGLLCITFCLCVTWPKFRLDQKSLVKNSYVGKYSLSVCDLTKIRTGPKVTWQKLIWAQLLLGKALNQNSDWTKSHLSKTHNMLSVWLDGTCILLICFVINYGLFSLELCYCH